MKNFFIFLWVSSLVAVGVNVLRYFNVLALPSLLPIDPGKKIIVFVTVFVMSTFVLAYMIFSESDDF